MTQAALGTLVGIHQTWVSDIELGRGKGVSLATWVAIGVATDRPLAVSFSKPIDGSQPIDAGHLEMQEALLELAARSGRSAVAELPTRPLDPRHSIDVAVWDRSQRTLIIQEAWNTFGDIGAAIRSTSRKQAEAADLATVLARDHGPTRVAVVWVVRASAANRTLFARYPRLFSSTFDGSSRRWVRALTDREPPPERPGLVWFDPSRRRITAWRRTPTR